MSTHGASSVKLPGSLARRTNCPRQMINRPISAPTGDKVSKPWFSKVFKSTNKNLVVVAIRGTASLSMMDWVVNIKNALFSRVNFLEDLGNSCHAGFLYVARSMVRPIASRLRQLL